MYSVLTEPGLYSSAHGDLIYVVSEPTKTADPDTYQDYRFILDLTVGANPAVRLKALPRPDNKLGVFNIGNVVRNYFNTALNPGSGILCQQMGVGDFLLELGISLGEEYNFITYPNITSSDLSVYNHYDGRTFGSGSTLSAKLGKVASNRMGALKVHPASTFSFLPFFPSTADVDFTARSYTEAGANVATYSTTFSPTGQMLIFNVSPSRLNTASAGFITPAVAYYTVEVEGDLYRFDLICEPKYDRYSVHFLNQYGGFESKDFTKVSRRRIEITKTDYGRLPYDIDASGVVRYFNAGNVYNDTAAVYASQYMDKLTLNSDFISDQEYEWLGELMRSPMVYVQMGAYFIPARINGNNYEYRKHINDKFTNITLDIEFGETFNAQFR